MRVETVRLILESYGVKRYHTARVSPQELGQHSARVAVILAYLKGDWSLTPYALVHDVPEIDTGDIPATTKWRYPELSAMLDRLEKDFAEEHGLHLPMIPKEDGELLRAADMIELVLYCNEQIRAGNTFARDMLQRGVAYVHKLKLSREVQSRVIDLLRPLEVPLG